MAIFGKIEVQPRQKEGRGFSHSATVNVISVTKWLVTGKRYLATCSHIKSHDVTGNHKVYKRKGTTWGGAGLQIVAIKIVAIQRVRTGNLPLPSQRIYIIGKMPGEICQRIIISG